jgi:CDP-glucose 4,6-dehydratase
MVSELGKTLRSLEGPILITGHTGFKGTWLTMLLESLSIRTIGYSLAPREGDLFLRANRKGRIPETFDDIRDISRIASFLELHKPSAIFHLAAQPLVLESYKDPIGTFATNVLGTANVLETAFNESSVQLVCVITTDKVYRNDNSGRRFKESDPLEGKDPYSTSKVGTESVATAWKQISEVSGGPLVSVYRAGNVIGGGDFANNRLIPDIIRGVISNEIVDIRNPKSTRPWQHVLDPLTGYIMGAEYSLKNRMPLVLNFGPKEQSLSVGQVLEIARASWGRINYKIDTQFDSKIESETLELDSSSAGKILGWNPKMNQSASVESTIMWWKEVIEKKSDPCEKILQNISVFLR